MKTTITRPALVCDGCGYVMKDKRDVMMTLEVRGETFHFHDDETVNRHDCFRYWAHNPRIMKESLKNRSWGEERIDEFMTVMLYREDQWSPGVARGRAT